MGDKMENKSIVEQVREGLTEKIDGINIALQYVRDPREIERLQSELSGANRALDKLNEPDTRSKEEIEKIANMVESTSDFESTPATPWSSLSDEEKLEYQMDLYFDKLKDSLEDATKKKQTLLKVSGYLGGIDFERHPYMRPLYVQTYQSLKELEYSIESIKRQMDVRDLALLAVKRSFDDFDIVNQFLNNPMALPHLNEKKNAELEELRNGDSKKS